MGRPTYIQIQLYEIITVIFIEGIMSNHWFTERADKSSCYHYFDSILSIKIHLFFRNQFSNADDRNMFSILYLLAKIKVSKINFQSSTMTSALERKLRWTFFIMDNIRLKQI